MEKNRNTLSRKILIFLTFFQFSSLSYGAYDDDNYEEINYKNIVSKLAKSRTPITPSSSSFSQIKIHTSVGFIHSINNISIPNISTKSYNSFNKGIQISLGIDLFSRNWLAEGSILNYDNNENKNNIVSLKEFDMKIVYRQNPGIWVMKGGLGLAARYMNIEDQKRQKKYEYSTPSSLLFVGTEARINKMMGFSAEISWRSAMIVETADKSSLDLALKLNTRF